MKTSSLIFCMALVFALSACFEAGVDSTNTTPAGIIGGDDGGGDDGGDSGGTIDAATALQRCNEPGLYISTSATNYIVREGDNRISGTEGSELGKFHVIHPIEFPVGSGRELRVEYEIDTASQPNHYVIDNVKLSTGADRIHIANIKFEIKQVTGIYKCYTGTNSFEGVDTRVNRNTTRQNLTSTASIQIEKMNGPLADNIAIFMGALEVDNIFEITAAASFTAASTIAVTPSVGTDPVSGFKIGVVGSADVELVGCYEAPNSGGPFGVDPCAAICQFHTSEFDVNADLTSSGTCRGVKNRNFICTNDDNVSGNTSCGDRFFCPHDLDTENLAADTSLVCQKKDGSFLQIGRTFSTP